MTRVRAGGVVLAAGLLAGGNVGPVAHAGAPAPQASVSGAVRAPAVAGQFYPSNAQRLRHAVEGFLRDAVPATATDARVLIVPHAGLVFSGQIAADAWAQVRAEPWDTIVILGTNHTAGNFDGASVYDGAAWRTPLGTVAIDREMGAALVAADVGARWDRRHHEREHSIEVQVPFVQVLFPSARILPVVVSCGDTGACGRIGRALAAATAGRRALIVASSDLSHYPDAAQARRVDTATLEALTSSSGVLGLLRQEAALRADDPPTAGLATYACGLPPIVVAVEAARELGARRATVISYAHSGDTAAGERDRVVGYGAVAYSRGEPGADTRALVAPRPDSETPLDVEDRRALLRLARETIARRLASETLPLARSPNPRLLREAGVFVTLTVRGELRGCVGRLVPEGSLQRLTGAMAAQAAFADPRFPPLRPGELDTIEIEVAVLTPLTAVAKPDDIVVGRHGVVLTVGDRSAVFLPYVAVQEGWSRTTLLDELARKAGLAASVWRGPKARLQTFEVEAFKEADVR